LASDVLICMGLKINRKAPDFRLTDSLEKEFHLAEELGPNGLLLLFYPKAFSPGCTQQVCGFSEEYKYFLDKGVRIAGISHDSPETLQRFRERYSLPFRLLSDPRRVVCRMYDAVYPFGLLTRRISYYLNAKGEIGHISDNLLNPRSHLREIRDYLERTLPAEASTTISVLQS
jgi:peroxiredoxin Q/BCP